MLHLLLFILAAIVVIYLFFCIFVALPTLQFTPFLGITFSFFRISFVPGDKVDRAVFPIYHHLLMFVYLYRDVLLLDLLLENPETLGQ
jgi:hypothetical protein